MTPDPVLQDAIALHRRGDLDGALARYQALLRTDPNNVDALHHLAMAHCQRGQFADGIAAIRKAIALAPARAAAHNLLGMALSRTGDARAALASFEQAIAAQENFAEAHGNRAGVLAELGSHDEALRAYARALALDPSAVSDWINQGALQLELRRYADAVASFDRALSLQPNIPEAHFNRGNALRALSRNADAIEAFGRCVAAQPRFAEAFLNRGLMHLEDGEVGRALADLDRVVAIDPAHRTAWRHRALALLQSDRFADAVASADRALSIDAADTMAHFVRGLALFNLGRDTDALANLDRVVRDRPQDARAQAERAAILNALGRTGDAFAALDAARALDPANPYVIGIAADVYLLGGRWREGWPLYERRFEIDPAGVLVHRTLAGHPRWSGEPPDGRPLLLVTEQGLGDAIQFARFATTLNRQGHRVVVMTAPVLAPLLATVAGVERVIASGDALDSLEPFRWCPFLSLPALIGLTPETLPADVPYLRVADERVAAWRSRIGAHGLKVGIAWQGNPNFRFDRGRSIALNAFAPLAVIPDIRLISLQKQPGADQVAEADFRDRIETPMDPLDRGSDALLDLATVMQALDVVVTSDSMPAHLAGALGVPTMVALRHRMLDWRWLPASGERSPFYPTLTLYRQAVEGDWASVFARIAADLAARPRS